MMNWIHLDLKGTIPTKSKLIEWLDWLKKSGFTGIVWEYENRIDWKTWPDTYRPGYSEAEWAEIWAHCTKLGLETMSLIQTQGHLEWLLRENRFSHMREAGHVSELCSNHPEVMGLLTR